MKKLMFAVAAVAAGTVLADVTSANVVGYQNKADTRAAFNYVTATFRPVSGGNASIQDIQLDASVPGLAANFQRINEAGGSACLYTWFTLADAADAGIDITPYQAKGYNGIWINYTPKTKKTEAVYEIPFGEADILGVGEGIQISLPSDGKTIQFNGQVSDETVHRTSRAAFNYVGNPFPADCSVQDFQLDATVPGLAANFQRINEAGGSACLYTWFTLADAADAGIDITPYEGLNGIWINYTPKTKKTEAVYEIPDGDADVVTAGSTVQISMPAADKDMQVLAPFDL